MIEYIGERAYTHTYRHTYTPPQTLHAHTYNAAHSVARPSTCGSSEITRCPHGLTSNFELYYRTHVDYFACNLAHSLTHRRIHTHVILSRLCASGNRHVARWTIAAYCLGKIKGEIDIKNETTLFYSTEGCF